MKTLCLALNLFFLITGVAGQMPTLNVQQYHKEQLQIEQKGMWVLGGWAAVNIISGAYYAGKTNGSTASFHRMNMYWNLVNGALATSALLRLPKARKRSANFAGVLKQQQKLEKTFLLNAGLDLAYITAGIALKESSKNNAPKRDRRFGYGNSLLLQGGFLLLFDAVMYTTLHRKGKALEKVLEKVDFSLGPTSAGLMINL